MTRARTASSFGAACLALLGLAWGFAGCGAEARSDAGADVGVAEDAPAHDASSLDAALDAPRRSDAGYDSGARCELPSSFDAGPVVSCNGRPELCARRLDEVVFATTHNAMSSEEDGFRAPNQHFRLWRQLEDGIRGFMLDVWVDRDGTTSLCHGSCLIGHRPLVDGLRDLRLFLDCHPHDVIVLVLEAHTTEDRVAAAFTESGLERSLYRPAGPPADGYAWPTLAEMIAADERVVVFTDDRSATLPWHLYTYDWAWENPYAADTPAALSCAQDRGDRARSLWVFNHFLTSPVASPALAEMVNHDPFFTERVARCREDASGDLPNFVTVDFYDLGDVLSVVDALNARASP